MSIETIKYLNTPTLVFLVFISCLLYSISRRGWPAFLAAAWVFNLAYIYLEKRSDTYSAMLLTVEVSSLSSIAFLLAARNLGGNQSLKAPLITIVAVYTAGRILPATFRGHDQSGPLVLHAIPHCLLSAYALTYLARNLASNYANDTSQSTQYRARYLLLAIPLHLYGFLQLLYPGKYIEKTGAAPLKYYLAAYSWAFPLALASKMLIAIALTAVVVRREILQPESLKAERAELDNLRLMLGGLAHEIKTPLQALRNYATVLKRRRERGADMSTMDKPIAGLLQQIQRMSTVYDRMKAIIEPDCRLQIGPVRVNAAIQTAIDTFRAADRPTDFVLTTSFAGQIVVRAHAGRLEQVFTNVLRNAYEATRLQPGKGFLFVSTRKARIDGHKVCVVSFRDNGCGIPARELDNVVRPYYSTKSGDNRGLGLFVAKYFLKSFDGQIAFSSPPENHRQGTEVRITLALHCVEGDVND